jgi:CDP-paratose 2-epimerase
MKLLITGGGGFLGSNLAAEALKQKSELVILDALYKKGSLHSDDIINLYFSCVKNIDAAKGNAFNIGGSFENSLSLLELFAYLEEILDIKLKFTNLLARESDQKVFIADIAKAQKLIDWKPQVNYKEGIKKMLEWTKTQIYNAKI